MQVNFLTCFGLIFLRAMAFNRSFKCLSKK
nr:MAG TPA: hypothetical protein [Caudoviricetes sp.]